MGPIASSRNALPGSSIHARDPRVKVPSRREDGVGFRSLAPALCLSHGPHRASRVRQAVPPRQQAGQRVRRETGSPFFLLASFSSLQLAFLAFSREREKRGVRASTFHRHRPAPRRCNSPPPAPARRPALERALHREDLLQPAQELDLLLRREASDGGREDSAGGVVRFADHGRVVAAREGDRPSAPTSLSASSTKSGRRSALHEHEHAHEELAVHSVRHAPVTGDRVAEIPARRGRTEKERVSFFSPSQLSALAPELREDHART